MQAGNMGPMQINWFLHYILERKSRFLTNGLIYPLNIWQRSSMKKLRKRIENGPIEQRCRRTITPRTGRAVSVKNSVSTGNQPLQISLQQALKFFRKIYRYACVNGTLFVKEPLIAGTSEHAFMPYVGMNV